jgi:hypothetical protein
VSDDPLQKVHFLCHQKFKIATTGHTFNIDHNNKFGKSVNRSLIEANVYVNIYWLKINTPHTHTQNNNIKRLVGTPCFCGGFPIKRSTIQIIPINFAFMSQ